MVICAEKMVFTHWFALSIVFYIINILFYGGQKK